MIVSCIIIYIQLLNEDTLSRMSLSIRIGFLIALITTASGTYTYPDVEVCDLVNTESNNVLWQPMGCATMDALSNEIIFVDSRNQYIRKLDRNASILSTLAGRGVKSHVDGVQTDAGFNMPYSIATPPIMPAPYAVVADYGNKCIRNISFPQVMVSSPACGGLITSPSDVAVLPNGNVYIADAMSHTILFFNSVTRVVTRIAGQTGVPGFTNGNAMTTATFRQPLSVVVHAFTGDVYIADWLNDAVRVITTSSGTVSTLVGGSSKGFRDGAFASALISGPKMVRMVGTQILAVSDSDNGAIRLLDLVNRNTTTLLGNGTRAHASGSVTIAKGSAIWGMSGALNSSGGLIFTEADSNTVRHAVINSSDGMCTITDITLPPNTTTPAPTTTTTPPPSPIQCGDVPAPSILNAATYLFTTGDAGFLSVGGANVITSRMPPSTVSTRTVLALPHTILTNTVHQPLTASTSMGSSVPPASVSFYIKTQDVYMDTCR